MTRAHFKFLAKQQRDGKVGVLFVTSLLSVLVVLGASVLIGLVVGLLILIGEAGMVIGIILAVLMYFATLIVVVPALNMGYIMMLQHIADKPYERIKATYIFKGFRHFWPAFKVMFFNVLFTYLWTLLGIIPGVIKSYSYSQAMFIIAENPEMGALAAITRSRMMMRGRKFDYFVLCQLSFYPWFLLLPFTLGILAIWLVPYVQLTCINFYNHAKRVPGSPVYGIPTYGEIVPAHMFMPAFMSNVNTANAAEPKASVAEEPIAEEPVAEEPVAEEPVVEEPVVEEPVVEEFIDELDATVELKDEPISDQQAE